MSHKKRNEEEVDEEVERIVAEIIAKQVLTEARIIARWNKKPFYVS